MRRTAMHLTMVTLCTMFLLVSGASARPSGAAAATDAPESDPTSEVSTEQASAHANTPAPSKEKMALLEYELSEKIEKRVMSSLKTIGAILAIVLAVASYFGASVVLDYLARRVEKQVSNRLDEDIGLYRKRLQKNLVELEMSTDKQKSLTNEATRELETLKESNEELKGLKKDYTHLQKEVRDIRSSVQEAISQTAEAEKKTEKLREAVTESAAGNPAVFGSSFKWEKDENGSVSGKNFGTRTGQLCVILSATKGGDESTQVSAEPFSVEVEQILKWSDTEITYHSSEAFREQIEHATAQLNSKLPAANHYTYEYIVRPEP